MAIYLGKIYSRLEKVSLKENLTLFNYNVKFLNKIITDTTAIEEKTIDNKYILNVTFFHGSRFSQTLSFISHSRNNLFISKDEAKNISDEMYKIYNKETLSNVFIVTGINELTDVLLKNGSWFIRNSETLDIEDCKSLPNEWRSIDGRGMALFEKMDNAQNAYRLVLLVMLSLAYYYAFQQINEELAEVLSKPNNEKELDQLYTDAAIFNARYYFDNPIEFSRYPTFRAWQDIRDAYQITSKNKEITSQLAQVHQILSYTKQKEEQASNEQRNLKISIFGLIISAIGIISVIDTLIEWFK